MRRVPRKCVEDVPIRCRCTVLGRPHRTVTAPSSCRPSRCARCKHSDFRASSHLWPICQKWFSHEPTNEQRKPHEQDHFAEIAMGTVHSFTAFDPPRPPFTPVKTRREHCCASQASTDVCYTAYIKVRGPRMLLLHRWRHASTAKNTCCEPSFGSTTWRRNPTITGANSTTNSTTHLHRLLPSQIHSSRACRSLTQTHQTRRQTTQSSRLPLRGRATLLYVGLNPPQFHKHSGDCHLRLDPIFPFRGRALHTCSCTLTYCRPNRAEGDHRRAWWSSHSSRSSSLFFDWHRHRGGCPRP